MRLLFAALLLYCWLQPYGVSGTQPPPGLVLEEGRDFTYTAYFGNVPASQCGQQWQVRPQRPEKGRQQT
jgi:hypothetical protein